jgi:predicted RNA-binding Zn-ribbon protein involved in translation (DUF1610 family)
MSIVKGNFSFTCNKCGKQHSIPDDEADFDLTMGDEGPMGTENGYSWNRQFECDKCGNMIEIDYEVWEYPSGAFNNDSVNVKGGTVVGRFDYDFHGEPDEDY